MQLKEATNFMDSFDDEFGANRVLAGSVNLPIDESANLIKIARQEEDSCRLFQTSIEVSSVAPDDRKRGRPKKSESVGISIVRRQADRAKVLLK